MIHLRMDLGPLDPEWQLPDEADLGTMDTLPQHFALVNGANCDATEATWVQDDGMAWQRPAPVEDEPHE